MGWRLWMRWRPRMKIRLSIDDVDSEKEPKHAGRLRILWKLRMRLRLRMMLKVEDDE
jgi:hypothetical protein